MAYVRRHAEAAYEAVVEILIHNTVGRLGIAGEALVGHVTLEAGTESLTRPELSTSVGIRASGGGFGGVRKGQYETFRSAG
jgi:hypothetical protein